MANEIPLDVILRAKASMQQGIADAMSQLKKYETDAFRVGGGGGGGAGGGLLETGLKLGVAVNAARAAFSGLNAVIKLAQGDTEAMWESIYKLPLGLGAAAREGKALWDTLSGAAEAARRIEINKDALKGGEEFRTKGRMALLSEQSRAIAEAEAEFSKSVKDARDRVFARAGPEPSGSSEEQASQRRQILSDFNEEIRIAEELRDLALDKARIAKLEAEARLRSAVGDDARQINLKAAQEAQADRQKAFIAAEEKAAKDAKDAAIKTAKEIKAVAEPEDRRNLSAAVVVSNSFRGLAAQREDKQAAVKTSVDAVKAAIVNMKDEIIKTLTVHHRDLPRGIML